MRQRGVGRLAGYIFSVYAALIALICNIVTWSLLLILPGAARRRRVARFGTLMVFRLSGLRLGVAGLDNLPPGHCIIISNHRSYFDGLALIAGLPPGFSPLIKEAVNRIPVLGRIMDRAGSVYIRRTPTHAAAVDTLKLIRRTRRGLSPAIFAEGTLSPDRGLLPFRDGAFVIAGRTGLPVVPVAVTGTDSILPPGGRRIRFGAAHVRVGRPIWPAGPGRAQARHLRDAAELGLWRLLSPETVDWRQELSSSAYYRQVLARLQWPVGYVDIDALSRRTRQMLRQTGAARLRLDARVVGYPALGLRIWRSDVRFAGVLVDDFAQAKAWLAWPDFRDMIVWRDIDDRLQLAEATALARGGGELTLCVGAVESLDRIATIARQYNTSLAVCLRLGAAATTTATALGDAIQAFMTRCDALTGVTGRGVVIADTLVEVSVIRATASSRRAVADRGRPSPLISVPAKSFHDVRVFNPADTEAIVGLECFSQSAIDDEDYPIVATASMNSGGQLKRERITPARLAADDRTLFGVYGGAVVARMTRASVSAYVNSRSGARVTGQSATTE